MPSPTDAKCLLWVITDPIRTRLRESAVVGFPNYVPRVVESGVGYKRRFGASRTSSASG